MGKLLKKIEKTYLFKEIDEEVEDKEDVQGDVQEENKVIKIIMVTYGFDGLGFAIQEVKDGNKIIIAYKTDEEMNDKEKECYEIQGVGMVNKLPLDEIMKNREEYRDYYFIWDGNHNYEEGELLISEGFKVWGGTKFTYDLENDRDFGKNFAESCGLYSPMQQEFSSAEEGISFLEEHEEEAFVFKPNASNDNSMTYVPINEEPSKANKELISFIQAFDGEDTSSYILQKIVKGVEVNVEGYFVNGRCVFAHANFENKKNHDGELGKATGCAFDIDFEVSTDSRLYKMTVGKMENKLSEMGYTGLADVNSIIGDYNEVNFIEFCFRMGYNMGINLHNNLCNKTMLQTCCDMVDGIEDIKAKSGFGATVTMFSETYHKGLPIYIPEDLEDDIYYFDVYKDEELTLMAGTYQAILVVCAHGYTISETLKDAEDKCRKIVFKDRYFRTDAWKHEKSTSPQRRYEALNAMKLL